MHGILVAYVDPVQVISCTTSGLNWSWTSVDVEDGGTVANVSVPPEVVVAVALVLEFLARYLNCVGLPEILQTKLRMRRETRPEEYILARVRLREETKVNCIA
jgi:hypothetical protein